MIGATECKESRSRIGRAGPDNIVHAIDLNFGPGWGAGIECTDLPEEVFELQCPVDPIKPAHFLDQVRIRTDTLNELVDGRHGPELILQEHQDPTLCCHGQDDVSVEDLNFRGSVGTLAEAHQPLPLDDLQKRRRDNLGAAECLTVCLDIGADLDSHSTVDGVLGIPCLDGKAEPEGRHQGSDPGQTAKLRRLHLYSLRVSQVFRQPIVRIRNDLVAIKNSLFWTIPVSNREWPLNSWGSMEKSLFTEDYQTLLRLLRDIREQAGTSQVQIATRLGTTQSLISKCERGERRLDAIELRRWVLELGVSFPDFLLQFEVLLRKPTPKSTHPRRKGKT